MAYIDEFLALLPNLVIQLIAISFSFFFLNDRFHARSFTVTYVVLLTVMISLKMYGVRKLLLYWNTKGINQKQLVIVGEFYQVSSFLQLVQGNPQFGYRVAGARAHHFLGEESTVLEESVAFLNKTAHLSTIDELVIALSQFNEGYVRGLIQWADKKGILVRFTPGFFQFSASRYSLELFGNYPLITVRSTPLELNYWWGLKRAVDLILSSLFLLFIASWLFPVIALAVRLDSKGPVFFIQDRWGQKGKNIRVWKFRTMYHKAASVKKEGGFKQTTQNDPRVTKLGHFLRRTNLDELPQFINVFWGSMSIVGPRPHAVKHSLETVPRIDNYMVRHRIKPGITGWAQVNGFRGETREIGQMRKRVDYDIWYIENWGLLLDFQIMLRTAYNMLKGDPKAY
jgi:putative colanic acid biosynthesis UDP-glucose lipid carrier transferase